MITTSRYGKTSPKKNSSGRTVDWTVPAASPSPRTTGTELTDASDATTARRGGVGTTTVNSSVHAAT